MFIIRDIDEKQKDALNKASFFQNQFWFISISWLWFVQ